jgi:putative glutamine amidotransferase
MKTLYVLGNSGYSTHLRTLFKVNKERPSPNTQIDPIHSVFLFTGGEDIHPSTYKTENYGCGYTNPERDKEEFYWFDYCVQNKIPMIGICRGMQLFTVATGGFLLQDVGNHCVPSHSVYFSSLDKHCQVNSIHHQMCVPKEGTYEVLAYTRKQGIFKNIPEYELEYFNSMFKEKEPESLWFPKVKALGVQWHPEMLPNSHPATKIYLAFINNYIGL